MIYFIPLVLLIIILFLIWPPSFLIFAFIAIVGLLGGAIDEMSR